MQPSNMPNKKRPPPSPGKTGSSAWQTTAGDAELAAALQRELNGNPRRRVSARTAAISPKRAAAMHAGTPADMCAKERGGSSLPKRAAATHAESPTDKRAKIRKGMSAAEVQQQQTGRAPGALKVPRCMSPTGRPATREPKRITRFHARCGVWGNTPTK